VTRTREQAAGLVDRLHAAGATVTVVPMINTVPLATPDQVRAAAARLAAHPGERWAALTSATAVRLVAGALGGPLPDAVRLAVVGPETADAARLAGFAVALQPAVHSAEGLAAALTERDLRGAAAWLPAAEGAVRVLPDRLRAAGAVVEETPLYRTALPAGAPERLRRALDAGQDAVILTSASTARHLVAALDGRRLPEGIAVVCIGVKTAEAAAACGIGVTATAAEQSAAGLVDALCRLYAALP
jgi:uroporphyrinogen-III synthase